LIKKSFFFQISKVDEDLFKLIEAMKEDSKRYNDSKEANEVRHAILACSLSNINAKKAVNFANFLCQTCDSFYMIPQEKKSVRARLMDIIENGRGDDKLAMVKKEGDKLVLLEEEGEGPREMVGGGGNLVERMEELLVFDEEMWRRWEEEEEEERNKADKKKKKKKKKKKDNKKGGFKRGFLLNDDPPPPIEEKKEKREKSVKETCDHTLAPMRKPKKNKSKFSS